MTSGDHAAVGAPPKVLLNEISHLPPSSSDQGDPLAFHQKLPGYQRTPLVQSPALAERLGIGAVLVKVESRRLGLPAFKMLGASWASYRAILARTGLDIAHWTSVEEFADQLGPYRPLTLATATDGNHGRAVARTARLFGLEARVWVPQGTTASRIEAIESEGAICVRVDGTYDEAVTIAAGAADDRTIVVSDTSWPGYEDVPNWVVDGYSTMMHEVDAQIAEVGWLSPSVIAVPMGVGSLAAAVIDHHGRKNPRPVIIGAEPTQAACVMAYLDAGELVTIPGPHTTSMVGMACGLASALAMEQIDAGLSLAASFDDEWAHEAMRLLAADGIVAGATGAASLAVLLALTDCRPDLVNIASLGPQDVALVLVTEGDTDPENYRAVVGMDSHRVATT